MEAPQEELAYVAIVSPPGSGKPDSVGVMDVSPGIGHLWRTCWDGLSYPMLADELHHFGWNACSASLCPEYAASSCGAALPCFSVACASSRIYVIDTKPDPRATPTIKRIIEADELCRKGRLQPPSTRVHCGPDAIYINALGHARWRRPGRCLQARSRILRCRGARGKSDRGEQFLSYDFVWHLLHDTMITSEWGTPEMVESGVVPELLLGRQYGHPAPRLGC